MNIFVLDKSPWISAEYMCDKHIVKMISETYQMMSACVNLTVLPEFIIPGSVSVKFAYKNHPCTVWVRESRGNWLWITEHLRALLAEYDLRYPGRQKNFKNQRFLVTVAEKYEHFFPLGEQTEQPKCMPVKYHTDSVVDSYRAYYLGEKLKFSKWKPVRGIPEWIPEELLIAAKKPRMETIRLIKISCYVSLTEKRESVGYFTADLENGKWYKNFKREDSEDPLYLKKRCKMKLGEMVVSYNGPHLYGATVWIKRPEENLVLTVCDLQNQVLDKVKSLIDNQIGAFTKMKNLLAEVVPQEDEYIEISENTNNNE